MTTRFARLVVTIVAAIGLSFVVAPAPAEASGWIGSCFPGRGTDWGGGWCDGNGPDWTYRGAVLCSNGIWYIGVEHWAGDRRGSWPVCPTGRTATTGGVRVYYLGGWQYSVLY